MRRRIKGSYSNDGHTGGDIGSKEGCVNSLLYISTKCGQWERGSKNLKLLQTSYARAWCPSPHAHIVFLCDSLLWLCCGVEESGQREREREAKGAKNAIFIPPAALPSLTGRQTNPRYTVRAGYFRPVTMVPCLKASQSFDIYSWLLNYIFSVVTNYDTT